MTPQKREAVYTIAANLTLQGVNAVCGFILPPLVVRTFGSAANGMVSSIGQFIAYLGVVEAGLGGAAVAALYKPLAEGDAGQRDAILSAARLLYNRSGCLFSVLIAALAALYPVVVTGQVEAGQARLMVLVLGISGTAEYFLIGKYRVLLTADRKTYALALIQAAGTIANTVVSVVLITRTGASLLTVKAVSAAVYLSRYAVILAYARRMYPGLNLRARPDNAPLARRWDVLAHQITGLIVFNSPVVLLTIFCNLKDVSVYTVYALIFSALGNLMGSLSNGLQAFFGKMLMNGDTRRVTAVYRRYETVYFIALGWIYSCACLLTIPFMRIYTRSMSDAEYIQPALALLFVGVGVASKLRVPGLLLIEAAGHFRETKYRSMLEAGINLTVSVLFVIRFGFTGALLGSLCSYTYRTADIIIYSGRKFVPGTLRFTAGKIAFLFVCYSVGVFLLQKVLPYSGDSYVTWFVYALKNGVVLAAPGVVFIVAYLRRSLWRR